MKWSAGQLIAAIVAVALAALLIVEPPFEATAAGVASASQVVYGFLFDPPTIGGEAGRVDLPLLLLELAFVAFVGGAIFIATSQHKKSE